MILLIIVLVLLHKKFHNEKNGDIELRYYIGYIDQAYPLNKDAFHGFLAKKYKSCVVAISHYR